MIARPLLPLLLLAVFGCRTPEQHSADADAEIYPMIDARRATLFGEQSPFRLGADEQSMREKVQAGLVEDLEHLGILDSLRIAGESNQNFLAEKESLYISALNLSQERWRFGLRSEIDAGASLSGTGDDSVTARADGGISFSRILGSGANVVMGIGSSLLRFVSTGDGWDAVSDLSLSVTQPLLRGAGRKITLESLTQSERSLVYQVRDYERFRREFASTVARRVYGVLQAIDQLENEERNLENLMTLRKRNERLAEAGQLSDIEADQARQNELRSVSRIVELRGDLDRQVDEFKLFLGLPIDLVISLDHSEFDRLSDESPLLDALTEESAVRIALENRLDVRTSSDRVEDSQRALEIAADNLRPGLGLSVQANSSSADGRPLNYSKSDLGWSLGLSLDPAWDNLPERNTFRRAEISYGATLRGHERFIDQVELEVREALRRAINAKERYRIQKGALELANRRVRSADLSLQAGRASTRDLLEARDSLLAATNEVTSSLIDFTLAQIELQLALEILRVDETGMHVDSDLLATSLSPESNEAIQTR